MIELRIDKEDFIRLRPVTEPWSEPKVQYNEWVDFEVDISLGSFVFTLKWPIDLLSSELMDFKSSLEEVLRDGHGKARLWAAENEIELWLTIAENGIAKVAGHVQQQCEEVRLSFELESTREMFHDLPQQMDRVINLYPYRAETKAEAKSEKRLPPFSPRK